MVNTIQVLFTEQLLSDMSGVFFFPQLDLHSNCHVTVLIVIVRCDCTFLPLALTFFVSLTISPSALHERLLAGTKHSRAHHFQPTPTEHCGGFVRAMSTQFWLALC